MLYLHSMSEIRVPQILEKRIQGKNQAQIASELGVTPMTIYRDRQTDLYQSLVNEFIELYTDKLKEFVNSGTPSTELEGVKEIGRILRTGITRQTKHTEDINIKANISIEEKRKQSEQIIKTLELTPDQFNKWTKTAKSENPDLEK